MRFWNLILLCAAGVFAFPMGAGAQAYPSKPVRLVLEPQLIQPVGSTPAELAAFLGKGLAKWGAIVKESGARAG